MTRIGLFHLTEAQLELLSAMAQKPDLEVVAAVHPEPDDSVFKIAQVLEVPTDTNVEVLREHAVEIIVVPDTDVAARAELGELGWEESAILTTREAAERWGLIEEVSLITRDDAPVDVPAGAPVGNPVSHATLQMEDVVADAVGDAAERASGAGPNLELMLRDGLDALTESDDTLPQKLAQLAVEWAELTDAKACAVLVDDGDRVGETLWATGGAGADAAQAGDAVLQAALDGIPQIYVRHGGEVGGTHRALGAFPLEKVRGAIWLLDFRLPAQGSEDRLQSLRRAARRLGRLLAMEGRVHQLARDRDAAVRVAALADSMAAATNREEILEQLISAIRGEVGAEFIVLRLEGESEPRLDADGLPADLDAARGMLVAAEDELSRAARVSLRTRQQPAMLVGERVVGGMSSPLRRGNELLGTVSIFSSQAHGEGELYGDRERLLLERLALHAAGSLALIEHDARSTSGAAPGHGVLNRKELDALLRAEVRRTDRYQVPFLLTVIDLVEPDNWPAANAGERFSDDFAQALRRHLREVDHLARVGKQRFAVLNPHTDRSGGRVVVRAQEVLKELEKRYPGSGGIDVHGNQVLYPGDVPTFEDLLQRLQI